MDYGQPRYNKEARKIALIYFLMLLVAMVTLSLFPNDEGLDMMPTSSGIKQAVSELRFDLANDILDIHENHISPDDPNYTQILRETSIEAHVSSIFTAYTLDASVQYDAYRLLYRLTHKEHYKEQMSHLKPIADGVNALKHK